MTQSLHTKPQVQELRKLLEDIECGMLTTIDNDAEVLNVKKSLIKIAQNMLNFGRRIKIF